MKARTQPVLSHGGDWYGYETEYGKDPLDYSMNVNPLGMPESVKQAIRSAADHAERYPDPLCRRLRQALSASEGIPADWVLCGNGAADLIFRLIPAVIRERAENGKPVHALIPAPSFSEYEQAVHSYGGRITYYPLREADGFEVREDMLSDISEEIDLVFLCQPNNPTGVTTPRELLYRILERCGQVGARMIVDECFIEFLDEPEADTMKGALAEYPNLVILKAFTKSYAMPGVRLGYVLCSDETFLRRMRECGQPWTVSILAEEAGLAALQEPGYLEAMRVLVHAERRHILEALSAMGIRVIEGKANFLLFWIPPQQKADFQMCMREHGILVRSCANYPGLTDGWFRIAVRTAEENRKLLDAIQSILQPE